MWMYRGNLSLRTFFNIYFILRFLITKILAVVICFCLRYHCIVTSYTLHCLCCSPASRADIEIEARKIYNTDHLTALWSSNNVLYFLFPRWCLNREYIIFPLSEVMPKQRIYYISSFLGGVYNRECIIFRILTKRTVKQDSSEVNEMMMVTTMTRKCTTLMRRTTGRNYLAFNKTVFA